MSKGYDFLGDKIRRLRIVRQHSQTELGAVLGLPKQAVSVIEKGERKVTAAELEKIQKFLHVSPRYFFEEGFIEMLEKDYNWEPRNKWKIKIPPFMDDTLEDMENYYNDLINSDLTTDRAIEKDIENIIKVFKLFLKEYKEKNK
jgi:transcriptional regulator with XRE-family HTH domain